MAKQSKKQEKLLQVVMQRISTAEQYRKTHYEKEWKNWYRIYRSRLEKRNPLGSNIFVPQVMMMVDVIRTRLVQSIFDSRPYVAVLPREEQDGNQAEAVQMLLDWQFSERMDIASLFKDEAVLNLCVFGTAVTHTGWKKKVRKSRRAMTREVKVYDEVTGLELTDSETGEAITSMERYVGEDKEVIYDDPAIQCINLFDFFVDPPATDIADARYCGHRELLTRKEIEQMKEVAGWKLDFSDLEPVGEYDDGWSALQAEEGRTYADNSEGNKDPMGKYEVHHYWEDDRHVVIIGRKWIALDEENPYWHGMKPYDKCCYMPEGKSFYGIGIPELTHQLQDELNTVRNQRIDYCSQALRRMWKVRRSADLKASDLVWRQNGIIQLDNMDDVLEIQVAPIPSTAFTDEALIKEDMRYATGCHDILMGVAGTDETATTTMTKDNNASIRFKDLVMTISQQLLVPIAYKCVLLDQQFMTEERTVRLLNEGAKEVMTVSPYDLEGRFDLIYVGSSIEPMANEEQQREHMIQAYQMLANDQLYQNNPQAKVALMEELLKKLDVKEVEKLLPLMPGAMEMPPDGMHPLTEEQPMPQGDPAAMLAGALMGGGM